MSKTIPIYNKSKNFLVQNAECPKDFITKSSNRHNNFFSLEITFFICISSWFKNYLFLLYQVVNINAVNYCKWYKNILALWWVLYLKHFESKINVVCWRCRRDKSGEWISTIVENHGSLIIKKCEGFRFSSGHPPNAKEVWKRENSLLN